MKTKIPLYSIDIYLLPRQTGKTCRIIENFLLECIRNKFTENKTYLITLSRSSVNHIKKNIKGIIENNSLIDETMYEEVLSCIITPFECNKLTEPKQISKVFIDEYDFLENADKIIVYNFVKDNNTLFGDGRLRTNVQIYTSLNDFVYLQNPIERSDMNKMQPHNLLYHDSATHLAMCIYAYVSPHKINDRLSISTPKSYRTEFALNKAIL